MSTRWIFSQKWVLWTIIVVGMLLIVNMTRGIIDLLSVRDRVVEAEEQVALLEEEKRELEEQYAQQTTEDYLEGEIRNKLNMARPDEVVVLLPRTKSSGENESPEVEEQGELANWEKWVAIFIEK